MFLDFYRLKEDPFGVTPDPRYLYLSAVHREALASLYYGIESGRGFMALVAKPGMGKTTLLFQVLEKFQNQAQTALIFQTQCDSRQFIQYLFDEVGLENDGGDLPAMHKKLNSMLLREWRAGKRFLVVIDEAQNLQDSVLETVRLLSDFETPRAKLLQIILSGQEELAEKLSRIKMAQLRQRISMLSRLDPFPMAEVSAYIDHRLKVAGYNGRPLFTPAAKQLIAERSCGVPRVINSICFNALSLGYAAGRATIDTAIAHEAAVDLDRMFTVTAKQASVAPGSDLTAAADNDTAPVLKVFASAANVRRDEDEQVNLAAATSAMPEVVLGSAVPAQSPPVFAAPATARQAGPKPGTAPGDNPYAASGPLRVAFTNTLKEPKGPSALPVMGMPSLRVAPTKLKAKARSKAIAVAVAAALALVVAGLYNARYSVGSPAVQPANSANTTPMATEATLNNNLNAMPEREAAVFDQGPATAEPPVKTPSRQRYQGNLERQARQHSRPANLSYEPEVEVRHFGRLKLPPKPEVPSALPAATVAASQPAAVNVLPVRALVPTPVDTRENEATSLVRLRPVSVTAPRYPAAAKSAGIQGKVVVRALVSADGSVAELHGVQGDPLLVAALVNAVKTWRFQPHNIDGKPTQAWTDVSFTFSLRGPS